MNMKDVVLTIITLSAQLIFIMVMVFSLNGANVFAAGKFDPYVGPKPILIYVETDPWAITGRGALPRIAIYENGDAIYSTSKSDSLVYRVIRLSPAELDSVHGHLAPIFANPELERSYDLFPWADDRPSTLRYMCTEDTSRAVVIRGLTCRGLMRSGVYNPDSSFDKSAYLSVELYSFHKWLCELDLHGGREWLPKYVEVLLWAYSYAPDSSIYWPKEWPGLTSSRAVKQGDIYSIFLDVAQLPKLRSLLASRKERGAIEIEGKKMSVSYRYAFPHEGAWVQAFVEAEKERLMKGRER